MSNAREILAFVNQAGHSRQAGIPNSESETVQVHDHRQHTGLLNDGQARILNESSDIGQGHDQIRQGRILDAGNETVQVQLERTDQCVECQVLHTGTSGLVLSDGDAVLVWLKDAAGHTGVVLGRVGPTARASHAVVDPDEFAERPETLVLEAQGDLVLRNGQAKIKLGADGAVEIVCSSLVTRSRRLLRLLAPLIKLN